MEDNRNNLLATYITYKELYESGNKDVYDIISEFIKYTILDEGKTIYTRIELSDCIESKFGIVIPSLVLHSATKRLEGIERKERKYYIDLSKFDRDDKFETIQKQSLSLSDIILNQCLDYVKDNEHDIYSSYSSGEIKTAFLDFLLDKSVDLKLGTCFSKYVLQNSKNEEFIYQLNQIRAGHILYVGLSFNDNVGVNQGMQADITVYLDMEILFNLVGYNGLLFQKLSKDFLSIVQQINKNKNGSIKLKYFSETNREIDNFFAKAESLVRRHDIVNPGLPAMEAILKNCRSVSDVVDKHSDFKFELLEMGIVEDAKKNYYSSQYDKYNLEDQKIVDYFSESETDKNDNSTRLALVSHINKLRFGKPFTDYALCEAILLTETKNTIQMSEYFISELEENSDNKHYVPLAVNMYTLTNALWYRLNGALSVEKYPSTVDAVIRAQTVLSSLVNRNIYIKYKECINDYNEGILTKDKLIARISRFKNLSHIPEKIDEQSVEEIVEFLSDSDISKYDDEISMLVNENKQVQNKVLELEVAVEETKKSLASQSEIIKEQNNLIDAQKRKIREYEIIEKIKQKNKTLRKMKDAKNNYLESKRKCRTLILTILSALAVLILGGFIFAIIKIGWDWMEPITWVVGFAYAILLFVVGLWKNELGQSFIVQWAVDKLTESKKNSFIQADIDSLEEEIKVLEKKVIELRI